MNSKQPSWLSFMKLKKDGGQTAKQEDILRRRLYIKVLLCSSAPLFEESAEN